MIDKDTAIEVTQILTRRCYPYGDTRVDVYRYESLLVKIAVASSLIDEIYEAGKLYDRHEYSIQHISNRANEYLTKLRDTLCEIEYLPSVEDIGEVSDGYHTFNQLYHQRAVLFATIVNQNKDKAWKSWKHEDGQFCFDKGGEWFIVGVDTPEGSYTYHYEKKYWDMFDCEELDRGKHWDGHTEDDVTRLLSLPPVEPVAKNATPTEDCISRQGVIDAIEGTDWYHINKKGEMVSGSASEHESWYKHDDIMRILETIPSPPVEPRPVCEDAVSKHDLWRIIEDNAYWVTYNETSKEKGMTLTGINQALNECPPVEPKRPKGEWLPFEYGDDTWRKCSVCGVADKYKSSIPRQNGTVGEWEYVRNFCPNCGADMRGGKE